MQTLLTKDHVSPIVIALLSLVGCAIILVATARSGLMLATVSGDYFAATRSILSGGGYIEHDGGPYLYYPPLFPLVLAFFGLLGQDPAAVVRPLNAITFGLTVFVVGRWLYRNVGYYPFVIFSALMVAFAMPLIQTHILASSEPVLILLVVCCLFTMQRYLERGHRGMLCVSAILAMLAILTRYAGAALVPTGVLLIASRRDAPVRERIRHITVFSLIAVLPLCAWLARNYSAYSQLAPERGVSVVPLSENVHLATSIVVGWLTTGLLPTSFSTVAAGVLALAFVAILGWRYARNRESFRGDLVPKLFPSLLFSVFYTVMIVASVSTIALDDLNVRYMIPVFVPSLLCVVVLADEVRGMPGHGGTRRALTYGIGAVLILLAAHSVLLATKNARYYATNGAGGYAQDAWQRSAVVEYLKSHPLDGRVYSNESAAVYVLTGIQARLSPRSTYFHSSTPARSDIPEFRRVLGENGAVYLVWFDAVRRDYLMGVDELRTMFVLEPVAACADGTVYRVLTQDQRD